MAKPFRFYEDDYDEARLRSMSPRALRELKKDAEYSANELEIWIKSRVGNLPPGSGLHPDIVGKMGYRAALLRFQREIERAIDRRDDEFNDAFVEFCKQDFSAKDFESIVTDVIVYMRTKGEANENRKD